MVKTYEDGLNDAWEVVRRLEYELTPAERVEIFGYYSPYDIIDALTPQEVIEKLEKHDRIEVGDEVVNKYGWKKVVTKTHENGAITLMDSDGNFTDYYKMELNDYEKTGRHFPQIAEVLRQMQEE